MARAVKRQYATDVQDETPPGPPEPPKREPAGDGPDEILARHRVLRQERTGYEYVWQRIVALVWPHGSPPNSFPTPGQAVRTEVLDGTPEDACEMAAAGLHALLTNPATRWFELGVFDKAIARDTEAGAWLRRAADVIYAVLAHPTVRFQIAMDQFYTELLAMASAPLYVEDRLGRLPLIRAVPLACVWWAENGDGEVDTVHYCRKMSVRSIAERWGRASLPEAVEKLLDVNHGMDQIEVLHVVEPRKVVDIRRRDRQAMPWRSVYVLVDYCHILEDGGVPEFPWMCPRWRTRAGEIYGRGPGHKALSDADVLQRQNRAVLLAGERTVEPAWMVPDDGVDGELDARANRITTVRADYLANGSHPKPLHAVNGSEVGITLEMIEDRRELVRMAFLKALLQLIRDPRATATHVLALEEESKRGLSPILGRLEAELIAPLIGRLFAILQRAGLIEEIAGPVPEILVGQQIKPEFKSPAARAQQLAEAQAIPQAIELLKPLFDLYPDLADNMDGDEATRIVLDALGVPASAIRPLAQRDQRRQAQLEQQQTAQELEHAKNASVVAKNMASDTQAGTKLLEAVSRMSGAQPGAAAAPAEAAA